MAKKKPARKKKSRRRKTRARGTNPDASLVTPAPKGLGPDAGGQSGDIQGLSARESVASQSVEELVEDGQALEAEVVSGVEDAPDADAGEVTTREVPEDDIPPEYRERD